MDQNKIAQIDYKILKKMYGLWLVVEFLFWEGRHLSRQVKVTPCKWIFRVTHLNGKYCQNSNTDITKISKDYMCIAYVIKV